MPPNIVYCNERNRWFSHPALSFYFFTPDFNPLMYTSLVRPLLFQLDPENAHRVATALGEAVCSTPLAGHRMVRRHAGRWPQLEQEMAGIQFQNPVGIAAGFDKNAAYTGLLRFIGFGYAEYGSITAKPSPGNPGPRLFRLKKDRALINRMGLNNEGAETVCRGIMNKKQRNPVLFDGFPTGINIAKTHDPEITGDDAIRDYIISYRFARETADYISLNVSCPNTREGKTFEEKTALAELLDGILAERQDSDPPILVKFSPDTDTGTTQELLTICEDRDIRGYVLTNTSSHRNGLLTSDERLEKIGQGGLSGPPLFPGTLKRIEYFRSMLPSDRLLIACGGIDTPEKAVRMISTGANLLQLYTGLIYEGPSLISRINQALTRRLSESGASSLQQLPFV